MNRSFTIIELIIVISIVLISSISVLSFYNQYLYKKELEAEANKLIDILQLARNKAISGEKPSNVSNCIFNGYKINFLLNNSYRLSLCCGYNYENNECDNSSQIISNFSLKPNIIFYNNPLPIFFSELTGELRRVNNIAIILKHNNLNNYCWRITVNKSGVINTQLSCN